MIAGLGMTLGVGFAVLVTGPAMWLKHTMAESFQWSHHVMAIGYQSAIKLDDGDLRR